MAGPLTTPNLTQLKKALALATAAQFECVKAAEAGIDLGEDKTECDHLIASAQQMLDVYFGTAKFKVPTNEEKPGG